MSLFFLCVCGGGGSLEIPDLNKSIAVQPFSCIGHNMF